MKVRLILAPENQEVKGLPLPFSEEIAGTWTQGKKGDNFQTQDGTLFQIKCVEGTHFLGKTNSFGFISGILRQIQAILPEESQEEQCAAGA